MKWVKDSSLCLSIRSFLGKPIPKEFKQSEKDFLFAGILDVINSFRNKQNISYDLELDCINAVFNNTEFAKKLSEESKKEIYLLLIKSYFRDKNNDSKKSLDQLVQFVTKYGKHLTKEKICDQYLAIHPSALSAAQIESKIDYVNDVMYFLVISDRDFYKENKDNKNLINFADEYIYNNIVELLPIFKFYGFDEYNPTGMVGQRKKIIDKWLQSGTSYGRKTPSQLKYIAQTLVDGYYDKTIVILELSNGKLYVGPKGGIKEAEQREQFARALKTLANLQSGIFGVIGYVLGGDKGSDIGATFDAMAGAAVQGESLKQYFKSISLPMPKAAISYNLSKAELANLRSTKPLNSRVAPLAPKASPATAASIPATGLTDSLTSSKMLVRGTKGTALGSRSTGDISTKLSPYLEYIPKSGSESSKAEFKTARDYFNSNLRDKYARELGISIGSGGQVHHAIELQVLVKYPGVFSSKELNSFKNMRGIPAELNSVGNLDPVRGKKQLHNSKIRYEWDRLYIDLDQKIAEKKLNPNSQEYNEFVRQWLKDGVGQVDFIVGNFYSEHKIIIYNSELDKITTLQSTN